MTIKVAREQAEKEINEFLMSNRLKVEDDLKDQFDTIVEAMVEGRLIISGNRFEYTLEDPTSTIRSLSFKNVKECYAGVLMEMGREKDNKLLGMFRGIGRLTGQNVSALEGLGKTDTMFVIAVASIFLA